MKKILLELIAEYGSQEKLARAIGVKQGTITGWIHGKHGINELNALRIEKMTNGRVRAIDLCPRLAEIEKIKALGGNQGL